MCIYLVFTRDHPLSHNYSVYNMHMHGFDAHGFIYVASLGFAS
jgi:hypothetical protein